MPRRPTAPRARWRGLWPMRSKPSSAAPAERFWSAGYASLVPGVPNELQEQGTPVLAHAILAHPETYRVKVEAVEKIANADLNVKIGMKAHRAQGHIHQANRANNRFRERLARTEVIESSRGLKFS